MGNQEPINDSQVPTSREYSGLVAVGFFSQMDYNDRADDQERSREDQGLILC